LITLATALDSGDPPNPWPGGIPDPLWWLVQRCLELEPGTINAGVFADKPGFHNNVANNQAKWPDNYSVNPAIPPLLAGSHAKARAFDWQFPEAQKSPPNYTRINKYSARLLAASKTRDPRLRGWYEWFGTKDGANIGYGIYKNRLSSSDDSHDWHIHSSEITQFIDQWPAAHGYLSVLMDETLSAYLARGGQLVANVWPDGGIIVSTGSEVWQYPIGSPSLFPEGPQPAQEYLKHAVSASRAAEETRDRVRAVQVDLAAIKAELGVVHAKVDALAAGQGEITLTPTQIVMLGDRIAKGVLEPLAEAAETSANILREATSSPGQ